MTGQWQIFSVPVRPRALIPAVAIGCLTPLSADEWDRFVERLQEMRPLFLGEAVQVTDRAAEDRESRIRKLIDHD